MTLGNDSQLLFDDWGRPARLVFGGQATTTRVVVTDRSLDRSAGGHRQQPRLTVLGRRTDWPSGDRTELAIDVDGRWWEVAERHDLDHGLTRLVLVPGPTPTLDPPPEPVHATENSHP